MVHSDRYREEIHKSIDKLFEIEADTKSDEIRFFLERLHENFSEAHRGMVRQLVSFSLVWIASYAIREGVISGGEIASFKLERLELLLLVAPLALGILSYLLLVAANAQALLREAVSRSYKHFLPAAYELDLEWLVSPLSILSVEAMFQPRRTQPFARALFRIVQTVIGFYIILGPLAGILHASYLAWSSGGISTVYIALSTLIGVTFWLRGVVLSNTYYEMPVYDEDIYRKPANPTPQADG